MPALNMLRKSSAAKLLRTAGSAAGYPRHTLPESGPQSRIRSPQEVRYGRAGSGGGAKAAIWNAESRPTAVFRGKTFPSVALSSRNHIAL